MFNKTILNWFKKKKKKEIAYLLINPFSFPFQMVMTSAAKEGSVMTPAKFVSRC